MPAKRIRLTDASAVTVRLDADLRERLEESAKERGISLNRELNERLRRSIDREALEPMDERERGLVALLATVMRSAGEQALHFAQMYAPDRLEWLDDHDAFDVAAQAAAHVLTALRPARGADFGGDAAALALRNKQEGQRLAQRILNMVAGAEPSTPHWARRIELIRGHLGDLVRRIAVSGP
jgi:predicted transcriptional regulator